MSIAQEVCDGKLGVRAPETASGEVGEAIRSFNRMSARLQELDAAAREMRTQQHLGEIGEIGRGLAHTLRNPLNALGLSLEELAERAPDGDASDELVESARRQIRRMDHSIRSFLALASGGAGDLEPVNLRALVQDVVLEVLQDTRHRTPIEIEPGAAGAAEPVIDGIGAELRAVVQALVVNAVEASPPGSAVRLRLTPAGRGERIGLEIDDAGAGLPPEVRERLFTPHTTTKATGSGMGLFLAHRIATGWYAGRLEIRDRVPRGSTAVLELRGRTAPAGVDV
ncbi:MAG: ATP-binding protein [Acidobacteriota bacterium]